MAPLESQETGEWESTKEHDDWRYKYPELDTHQHWAKVYPQELFDFIDECAKERKEERKQKRNAKRKNRYQKNLTNFQLSFLKISKVFLYT